MYALNGLPALLQAVELGHFWINPKNYLCTMNIIGCFRLLFLFVLTCAICGTDYSRGQINMKKKHHHYSCLGTNSRNFLKIVVVIFCCKQIVWCKPFWIFLDHISGQFSVTGLLSSNSVNLTKNVPSN